MKTQQMQINHPYYKDLNQAIQDFLAFHKIPFTATDIYFWESMDIPYQRPGKILHISKLQENQEPDGYEIRIASTIPNQEIPFPQFRELISRIQYCCWPKQYLKDYSTDPCPFDQPYLETTCWHHCSIQWAQDSASHHYKLQIGLCTCS